MLYMRRDGSFRKVIYCGLGRSEIDFRHRHWLFPSQPRPNHTYGSPRLLPNGYQELLPLGNVAWNINQSIYPHLVPRLRMRGTLPPYLFITWCLMQYMDIFLLWIWYTYIYFNVVETDTSLDTLNISFRCFNSRTFNVFFLHSLRFPSV
jgi:hypothetical protein